ncbi:MAG TPA: hypothetical protein VEN81_17605, partial [Planctomycetota bacterium]|nr:hypothetical protein [Planctomycetota bacterium]
MKILLAIPGARERQLFLDTLASSGIPPSDLRIASSGESALEAVRTEAPVLIVAEWELPGAPGYRLVQGLKKIPGGRDVAVLYCLGAAQRAGAVPPPVWRILDFLDRPVSAEAFRQKFRTLEGRIETQKIQDRSRTLLSAAPAPKSNLPFFFQAPS